MTRSTSDSVCDDKKHGPACGADLAQQRVEALLHERIQPGDRLIQDQQLGLVHERLDQAELLPVAGRELADRSIEVCVEALDQRVTQPPIDAPSQRRQVVEHRPARQLRIQGQIAGQKANSAADLKAVA